MAFYDYIILNNFRYKTLAKQWKYSIIRPATVRLTLQGGVDSTFAPGAFRRWQGIVIAPYGETFPTPEDGTQYGNIVTLRHALSNLMTCGFRDHYGNPYGVTAQGPFEESSLVNIWNSAENKYYVTVSLIAKG